MREFARTLPRVRRALANIATYMIFDDHDVTDDWNLHRRWHEHVHGRPLGRRLVQNALAAYAVFQGWGNEPGQFTADRPGGRLLAALAGWDGQEGVTCEQLRARLGLDFQDQPGRMGSYRDESGKCIPSRPNIPPAWSPMADGSGR